MTHRPRPAPNALLARAPARASGQPAAVRGNTIIASAAGLISGVLNAGVLAVSARQGQTGEIAAYTVMSASLAWVSIVITGGSSLLYVSGGEPERHAVRSQRVLIVAPSLAAAAVAVAIVYAHRGYSMAALAVMGVVVIGNSLSELQTGDLARQMRFATAAAAICASRVLTLGLIIADAPLTLSLAIAALGQFVVLEALLCRGRTARPPMWRGLSLSAAVSAFRMNRQLFVYSLAEVSTGRVASIAVSWVASPRVVGCFGAVASVYQALGTVLYNGLGVSMAVRARRRHGIGPAVSPTREGEVMTVAGATVTAICVFAFAPWIATDLLRLPIPDSATWLRLFAVALPCMTLNRAVTLNHIGDGDYRGATRVAVLIAALMIACLAVQATRLGPRDAASATALAEGLTVAVLGTVALRRRRTTRIHTR